MKYWIYVNSKNDFRQVDISKIDTKHQYNPSGMARFETIKGRKWEYVHYANTLEECVKGVNSFHQNQIDKLKAQVADYEARLLTGNERAPKREKKG